MGLNQATALKVSCPCLLSMHKVCACAAWDRACPPPSLCQVAADQRSFEVLGPLVKSQRVGFSPGVV